MEKISYGSRRETRLIFVADDLDKHAELMPFRPLAGCANLHAYEEPSTAHALMPTRSQRDVLRFLALFLRLVAFGAI